MKKYILYLYLSTITAIIVSCSSTKHELSENIEEAEIIIYDSISVKPDNERYSTFNFDLWEQGYLLTASSTQKLRLLKIEKNHIVRETEIGHTGGAEQEYRAIAGLYANNNKIYIIDETSKLLVYDTSGHFLKSNKVYDDTLNEPYFFPKFLYVSEDSNAKINTVEYSGTSTKYTIMGEKHYINSAKILSIYKQGKKYVENYIGYEKDSPYQHQRLIGETFPAISKLPVSRDYVVIHPHDDVIYIYHNQTKEIKKKIRGYSEFSPSKVSGVPFGTRIDINTVFEIDTKRNATNIVVSVPSFLMNNEEFVFKQYRSPIEDKCKNVTEYHSKMGEVEERYLQLYNVQHEKKMYKDIKMPKKVYSLLYAKNEEYLIFSSNSNYNETTMLYIARLSKKNK
ncbi:MAG: hypothetical protein SFU27_10925 [Thermonemataceae bacterium]|nr:hypothetical protein [Thermonemataceae bacterium]